MTPSSDPASAASGLDDATESAVLDALRSTNQDEAVVVLREVTLDAPEAKLARYHLGLIYAGRGMHGQAAATLREVVDSVDDEDPGVWFLLSRQLHLDDQLDDALAGYDETVRLDPLCEKAFMYTAEILTAAGREPARALACAQAAVALRSSSSMLEEEVFQEVLEAARDFARAEQVNGGRSGRFSREELADLPLGRLIAEEPTIAESLASLGVRCVTCAGYSNHSIVEIAPEWGHDPDEVIETILGAATNNDGTE